MRAYGRLDRNEAERLRDLFEANGIPSLIETSRGSYALPSNPRLFVCIDSQLDDARRLAANPDHVVESPVDVAAFHRDMIDEGLPMILRNGAITLAVLMVVLAIVVVVHHFFP